MGKTFGIVGAGMQGTAAAYDLARFSGAEAILLADANLDQAVRSAERVSRLTQTSLCQPQQLDALDPTKLASFLKPVDVLLSCVPYWMHERIAPIAIKSGVSMCDLGGDTSVTLKTLALDEQAKAAGVTLIPDTGLAPGLVNSLGLFLIEQVDQADTVRLYCGVLPQHPQPPFNYKLTFNIEGLVQEYEDEATVLRDGEVQLIPTLSELESLNIAELGEMEAFTTSGGTSTAPNTLRGRVRNYEYKTIRFPGHCERMRIFKDYGFWGKEPVSVDGSPVIPRHLFYRVFGSALKRFEDLDQCLVRATCWGTKAGCPVRIQADIHDRQCGETGFTSMERLTGFSMAIHATAIAGGTLPTGCLRYENALTGTEFVEQIRRRGIVITVSESREV